jgi:hypothetical protein
MERPRPHGLSGQGVFGAHHRIDRDHHHEHLERVYATRLAGILDVKVAVSGPYDPAIESTVGLETDSAAGTARAVKVQMDTSASASATNPSYTMTMLADGFKLDTDVKGRVNWSANFMMASGSVTRGVASVAW